jgi:hypothetical protein
LSAGEIQDRLPRRTLSACASGQTPRIYAAARRSSSGGVGAISLQRALIAMASRIRRRNSSSEKERFQRPVSQSSTKCARRRSASARHLRETSVKVRTTCLRHGSPQPDGEYRVATRSSRQHHAQATHNDRTHCPCPKHTPNQWSAGFRFAMAERRQHARGDKN